MKDSESEQMQSDSSFAELPAIKLSVMYKFEKLCYRQHHRHT